MVTTTTSPASAAPVAVAARAWGPSSATRSLSVSGPRLLLSTTSWTASTASRATVLPMCPLPMSPMVVIPAARTPPAESFPAGEHPGADVRLDHLPDLGTRQVRPDLHLLGRLHP